MFEPPSQKPQTIPKQRNPYAELCAQVEQCDDPIADDPHRASEGIQTGVRFPPPEQVMFQDRCMMFTHIWTGKGLRREGDYECSKAHHKCCVCDPGVNRSEAERMST